MPTPDEAFAIALAHQQAGRLREAEQIYREILSVQPTRAAAWHLLGVLYSQSGRFGAAIQHIQKALELDPSCAEAHVNLGNTYFAQDRFEDAIASYRRGLQFKPAMDQAIGNLAKALHAQGRLQEAAECYRLALDRRPDDAELHFNLGAALHDLGKSDEALAAYRRAVALKPDYAKAHNNLGMILRQQRRYDDAIECYQKALRIQPNLPEAHNNLSNVFRELGSYELAAASSRRALELHPNYAEAHNSLGLAMHGLGGFPDAADCYRRALELKPDLAYAHFNRSLLWLFRGDFERAWPEFEWRWQTEDFLRRTFAQPRWTGEPIAGRTILLYAEQGLGDTIQFARYASLVKGLGATVAVECQRPLVKLLTGCPGIDRVAAEGDELPGFDVQIPLLSVPGIFKTSLATIPASVPYLFVDERLRAEWSNRLAEVKGFRIGINWQGRQGRGYFRQRDIPLALFAALADIPGVRLISLQHGEPRQELANVDPARAIVDLGENIDVEHGPFMDTAAIMMNLDLVISSDTAIPHLAGALGIPIWLALPHVPDWRWMLDRSDSPWYPTMRLFRQPRAGDWASVFGQIQAALQAIVASRH